jgi:hypothetical protein
MAGGYEQKRILVVVKTYPNPSRSYGETVCCAGVDLDTRRWVRIYPITFRRLADRRFAKFQEITCKATRPRDDARPESLRVDQDSIELVGKPMPTRRRGWARRMAALPPPSRSLEEIQAAQRASGTSLGMIRPKQIVRLVKRRADPWTEREKAYLRQEHLQLGDETARELSELEQLPWSFSYEFMCDDDRCVKGHTLKIIDWELGAAYRRWTRTYGGRWEEDLRERFERELPATDLHLIVGNIAVHPRNFVIIGLLRPSRPKVADGGFVQQSLDLMGEERPVAGVRVGLEAEQTDALGLDEGEEPLELFPDEA